MGEKNTNNQINTADFPFTENEGLKIWLDETASPADFVELYVTKGIIQLLVNETNRYAKSFLDPDNGNNNSYSKDWTKLRSKSF